MKKTILTAAIISALLFGCNENKTKHDNSETVHTEQDDHANHKMEGLDNSWREEIQLDGSKKWEANIETTESVDKMKSIIGRTKTETVEDYHALAKELNEVKNYLVKSCTMEGPSHDNLHIFLHPLIEKIGALGKVTTVAEGSEVLTSIKENLDGYYQYFE